MTVRDQRRFLLATATTATIGSAGGAGATRPGREDDVTALAAGRRGGADRVDGERSLRADGPSTDADGTNRTDAGRHECERTRADGGRETAGDRTDSTGDADSDRSPVEFLDCRRARIAGDYDDVILSIAFDAGDGAVGTIVEPVGGVAGERTIDAAAAFDLEPETTVLAAVELFATEEVATPGLGDLWAENPDEAACLEARLGHLDR